MAKKDFSTHTAPKQAQVIADATTGTGRKPRRSDYTDEERAYYAAEMRTTGRKGMKAIRINMAFTPDNADFVHTMAKVLGVSQTRFVNQMLNRYREELSDLYKDSLYYRDKVQDFVNGLDEQQKDI